MMKNHHKQREESLNSAKMQPTMDFKETKPELDEE